MSDKSRSAVVKERWGFLADCLRSAGRPTSDQRLAPASSPTQSTPVFPSSVRRFESFGLFQRESSPVDEPASRGSHKSLKDAVEEFGDEWDYEYLAYVTDASAHSSRVRVDLRLYRQLPSLHDLQSFNNTGNVCVWPSEECLAWFLLESSSAPSFASVRRVCELGGGMTALAGLMCALFWPGLDCVLLTDGNERSVANLSTVVELNSGRCLPRCVEAGTLRWGSSVVEMAKSGCRRQCAGQFDLLLCADCVFFEDSHLDLLHTVDLLLEPAHGRAIVVAPERTGSFERFRRLAAARFPYVRCFERYSARVSRRHEELTAMEENGYNADLHYPKMLVIGRNADDVLEPCVEAF